jgi:tetratricopeptide (TPR) repeat protein
MFAKRAWKLLLVIGGLALLGVLVYQVPAVQDRLSWRLDIAQTYLRGVLNPAEDLPTPVLASPTALVDAEASPAPGSTPPPLPPSPSPSPPTVTPTTSATLSAGSAPVQSTPTPAPTATPIPESVSLPKPAWEKQDWNNCGPAALSTYLRFYGWQGDQFDISSVIKPVRRDRNVNIEELAHYARNYAGWLHTQYRVGGDIELLKAFIAAGIPVMVESTFHFDSGYWPNDDLWAAHYMLVTGYDDATEIFEVQDTWDQLNRQMSYAMMDEYWQPFNRIYVLIYLPAQEDTVKDLLGPDWDEDENRQRALETAQAEIEADPEDAFAWFNLGTNLLYFEAYQEATEAYDQARTIGLPQRMLRYQFGPFFAYFHAGRNQDVLTLAEYALERTPNSEEALLWHGWALYRDGDLYGAIADFNAALEANPNYQDAQYALDFVSGQ